MKKKFLIGFAGALGAVSILAGCGGSAGSTETTTVQQETSKEIDFSQISSDLKQELKQYYDYLQDVTVQLKDNTVYISAALDDSTDPQLALDMADTLIRQTNFYANLQDSSIAAAGSDSYGGLYDKYDALIGIAPASKAGDSSQWFVYEALTSSRAKELSLNDIYK